MNCNQRNPILQLAEHITQDQTFQEVIGNPSGLGLAQNNLMPPQSFRMEDLMREMHQIEPQRVPMSSATPIGAQSHCLLDTMSVMEYENQLADTSPTNPQRWHEMSAQNYQNITPLNRFPQSQNFMENYHRPAHFEPQDPVESLIHVENGKTMKSFEELEDYINQPEQNGIETIRKHVRPEPELNSRTENRIREFDSARSFIKYMRLEFMKERLKQEWILDHPNQEHQQITQKCILNPNVYSHIENNPMKNIIDAREKGLEAMKTSAYFKAVLYFDEAVRKNDNDVRSWICLAYTLYRCNKDDKSISILKELLHSNPGHLQINFIASTIYYKYGCSYQACQLLLNWLKHNRSYNHLIPSDFTMDDKNTTKLDGKQFNALKDMFLKAAQQNPTNPDGRLQIMISQLYHSTAKDGDKEIDCRRTAINSAQQFSYELLNVGYMLFAKEKPYEALDSFFEASTIDNHKTASYEGIALVHMYLKNYREAIFYLKKALGPVPLGEETKFELQENTPEAEYELCLRLYWDYCKK